MLLINITNTRCMNPTFGSKYPFTQRTSMANIVLRVIANILCKFKIVKLNRLEINNTVNTPSEANPVLDPIAIPSMPQPEYSKIAVTKKAITSDTNVFKVL